MLETDYRCALNAVLQSLTSDVALPADWHDFFQRRGVNAPRPGDHRTYVRFNLPTQIVLQIEKTLPAVPRRPALHLGLMKDISRRGVGFLFSAQLYPGERVRLWLATGKRRCQIMRCRRHNDRCYEIGADFVEEDLPAPPIGDRAS